MPPRYISRLRLTNFRNYTHAALDLDGRHVVLVGPNGAGKTNLLEAISLLAPGRGLRRARFDELGALGSETGWAVAVTIHTPEGPVDVGTGLSPAEENRRVRINGAPARRVEDLGEHLRVLWLTPAMDGLFTGPASERRRFFDRLVTTLLPAHSATVSAYETAMRHRNRLLQERQDAAWVGAVESEMATHAAAAHFAREDTLVRLRDEVSKGLGNGFPEAALALTPLLPTGPAPVLSLALEAELRASWGAARDSDRLAGRTVLGPHTVDFEVGYAQKGVPAALGSTGEQKALLVGLVLAHARLVRSRTGLSPFMLLDEIAAHFDSDRRAALFAALDELGSQCLMTGTDPILFEALGDRAQRIWVRDGRLSREPGA